MLTIIIKMHKINTLFAALTQSEMQEARRILSEFQQQQLIAQKLRSLKAKEEELGRKEMQLQEKEKRLLEWEATLEKVLYSSHPLVLL